MVYWTMSATVLSLRAVRLVWYCLSGFFMLPEIFQICGQGWLVFILCISNWISYKGPPCVGIDNKLGEYPPSIGSVVYSYLRCENILIWGVNISRWTVWQFTGDSHADTTHRTHSIFTHSEGSSKGRMFSLELGNVCFTSYPVPHFTFVYNCTRYWDPNFLTAPFTYSAGGLMMTC